jgi:O-succinylbenzoic acid--CoA ligase
MDKISINNFLLQNQLSSSSAIISADKTLAYNQLARKSGSIKKHLSEQGVNENDFVGIFGEHTVEFVISILALWNLGAIPILLIPKVTQNELDDFLQSANCHTLVGSEDQLEKYSITRQIFITIPTDLNASSDEEEKRKIFPRKTAAIIFTSGSSDKPKGVKLSFNSFYQSGLIGDTILKHSAGDRWLASLPFHHVGGFSILIRALLFSVPIIIPRSVKSDELIKSITEFNPTLISFVSTQLKRLVDNNFKPNPELKNVLLGGGYISNDLVEKAIELGWKITKVYGSTETASFVTALSPKEFKIKPGSAGKPIAPNKIKIVDESNNTIAKNISGEVLISSPALMQGYLNEQDEDETEKEYFHSNDIGFIDDDGYLFLESRKSDIIISGGENINTFEVEKEILQHSTIREAAVFPLKSDEWGETVAAVIILEDGINKFKVEELKAFLKNKLAGFKIPKKIFIEKKLPKTELGKVEKKKLIEKYSAANL